MYAELKAAGEMTLKKWCEEKMCSRSMEITQ
jgi:hypothetical protein